MKKSKLKAYAAIFAAFLTVSTVLAFMPMAKAAGTIALTPTAQSPGASVSVAGTGFNATTSLGIGFGAEVAVTTETVVTKSGSGNGPYKIQTAYWPIKPGSFRVEATITMPSNLTVKIQAWDNGNGTLASANPSLGSSTINYTSGELTAYYSMDVSSFAIVRLANYTHYQYNATPAASVTTSPSGSFSANIIVPAVANGNYNITGIDAAGNRAVSSLSVVGSSAGWSKTYGGIGDENAHGEVVQTSDGYVISGDTSSFGAGGQDFWLFKVDAGGNMLWNKTYGGNASDTCNAMSQTNDGGYALIGSTASFGAGSNDLWLVKTNASGNMQWNKTYGGTGDDQGYWVAQTSEGGYAVAGTTTSFGAGNVDGWLIKTDSTGNMQWNKTYGAAGMDSSYEFVVTPDGGYTLGGLTTSYGAGGMDYWLVKTDAAGIVQWNKTYGGTGIEMMLYLIRTADGGYAMAGPTSSFGAGSQDYWLVKTDGSGNMQWNKTYGGTGADMGWNVVQTYDGGYALGGYTSSFGAGGRDFWLVKTDAVGNAQWNQTYGGAGNDVVQCLIQTSDGGYFLTGSTASFGAGGTDAWLVKTDIAGAVPEFPSWLLLSLALVATGFIVFGKRPMVRRR